jgi:hypothetical protein
LYTASDNALSVTATLGHPKIVACVQPVTRLQVCLLLAGGTFPASLGSIEEEGHLLCGLGREITPMVNRLTNSMTVISLRSDRGVEGILLTTLGEP